MTVLRLLSVALLLSACNMPDRAFRAAPVSRVSVAGAVFDVRVQGNRAEAIRINPQYAPRFGPIRGFAARAMAQVSGCKVLSVTGDQAQAFGRLACGDPSAILPPPPPDPRPRVDWDCVPVRGSEIEEIDQIRIEIDCDPA